MKDNIQISPCKQYVIVTAEGGNYTTDVQETVVHLNEIMAKQSLSNVLCDCRNRQSPPSTEVMLEMGAHIARETHGKITFAIVVHEPKQHQLFKQAANFNGANIEFFSAEEQAKEWLLR